MKETFLEMCVLMFEPKASCTLLTSVLKSNINTSEKLTEIQLTAKNKGQTEMKKGKGQSAEQVGQCATLRPEEIRRSEIALK